MTNDLMILSLIQGIGEFLPVSSTGHLLAVERFFHIQQGGLETHVILHFGSLLALLLYFFHDIFRMIAGIWMVDIKKVRRYKNKPYRDLAWMIVLTSLPTIVVGFIIKKFFGMPTESLKIIGIASIVFGILLIFADSNPLNDSEISNKEGFLIGVAQCFSLIPGASRSGVCLTAARLLGLNRVEATRFTFLMAIPVLLGAFTLTILDAPDPAVFLTEHNISLIILSALIGLITIRGLLWFLSRFSFFGFGFYRILFGTFLLFFI